MSRLTSSFTCQLISVIIATETHHPSLIDSDVVLLQLQKRKNSKNWRGNRPILSPWIRLLIGLYRFNSGMSQVVQARQAYVELQDLVVLLVVMVLPVHREVQVNLDQQVPQVKEVLLDRMDLKDLVATLEHQVLRAVVEQQVCLYVNCTTGWAKLNGASLHFWL